MIGERRSTWKMDATGYTNLLDKRVPSSGHFMVEQIKR